MHHWSILRASWLVWRWLITLWLGCLADRAWVAETPNSPTLLHDLVVLPDPGGTFDINAVAESGPVRFKAVPSDRYSGSFTRGAHWFRFTAARSGETWLELQPPVLDDLHLYQRDPLNGNAWQLSQIAWWRVG
jgi:hypothetical protein